MHVPTHLLSGWCVANTLPLTPKQRFGCVLAGILPDLDGVSALVSDSLYFEWHHRVGHNIFYGLLTSAVLACWCGGGVWMGVLCLALFHLHLVMDWFGSGWGWPIYYWWPFKDDGYSLPVAWVKDWAFDDWRNYLAMGILTVWTIWLYRYRRRGPLEYCWPYADGIFVRMFSASRKGDKSESN